VNLAQQATPRRVVFVASRAAGESLLCARAVGQLDGVQLFGICEHAGSSAGIFEDLISVENVHDAAQLTAAARELCERHGPLHQIVTAQETLLLPVAQSNEALGLRGMSAAVVSRVLDKSSLKRILERAGIGTARGRLVTNDEDAVRFVAEVGFPIVLKPLGGSGGLATWRIGGAEQLNLALSLMRPSPESPVLAEQYLRGEELCLDTITIANEPRLHSVCCYRPSIMDALEDARIQWTCVMPREMNQERFRHFVERGLAAVRALEVGDAMTHMEGFLLEGGGVRFTDATLRPAGARIGPMLGFAYDTDPRLAWARAAVDGRFDGPWERKYAVGTIFLRGTGGGTVESVSGVEEVKRRVGRMVAEARLPRVGVSASATYTGDGFITLRHPETRAVEDALQLIADTVRVTHTRPASSEPRDESPAAQWAERLGYSDMQLYRPAWDDDRRNDELCGMN
jgi:formate-dependent phosphoribosylglycinamide formyltransferase (GAR transformylase)